MATSSIHSEFKINSRQALDNLYQAFVEADKNPPKINPISDIKLQKDARKIVECLSHQYKK
jgi:hypothetical protein